MATRTQPDKNLRVCTGFKPSGVAVNFRHDRPRQLIIKSHAHILSLANIYIHAQD
jgi:hypothetical protein